MQLWVKHAKEITMATEAVDKSGDVARSEHRSAREWIVPACEHGERVLAEK
jgi:hypothetical protein